MSDRGQNPIPIVRAKKRAKSRARALRVTALVGVLGLVLGCAGIVWFSPLFSARSVEVTGLTTLTTDQVVSVAAVPLGTPLVRLDRAAIIARVETLTQVDSVSVARHIDGVVELRVVERQPVYVLAHSSGYQLVDRAGVAYLPVASPPENVPVVTLASNEVRMLQDAATVVLSLPSEVTSQAFSVEAATPDSFTIHLATGGTVMWGSAEESDLKGQVLAALLSVSASYYDVSSPSHPATR
ncbi:MAG: FtsQ-type POTRA domain-containing protein [Propionibacteriaceae bacterium]|jgi:cell division protein FtsQ|nr:FtsQ-type POTRA domain-containing protein [Propionibacteriaceae bacterium]